MEESIKRGDVVWVDLPPCPNSHVQTGERPAIVVQNDMGNLHSPTTIVVPVTSVIKRLDMSTHVLFEADFLPRQSVALCEQFITVDKGRISSVAGHLPKYIMQAVNLGIIRSVLS